MTYIINEKELLKILNERKKDHFSAFYKENITDNQILSRLNDHIKLKDVITVLLRGSRATGRNNPYSDVDIIVVKEETPHQRITFKDENNVRYNVILHDRKIFKKDDNPIYRMYYGAKVLYGNKELGEEIVNKIQKYVENICSKIIKKNPKCKKYLYELLEFIDEKDPITSSFAKAKILGNYPAYLAYYNGFDLIGFKTIIDCLVRDNYNLACVYLKALNKKSTKEDLKELIDKSFNELCGINVLDKNFKNCKTSYDLNIYKLYNDYRLFLDCVDYLKPRDMLGIDFIFECNKKAPKLFDELWSYFD